jgi:hypothetical protein
VGMLVAGSKTWPRISVSYSNDFPSRGHGTQRKTLDQLEKRSKRMKLGGNEGNAS